MNISKIKILNVELVSFLLHELLLKNVDLLVFVKNVKDFSKSDYSNKSSLCKTIIDGPHPTLNVLLCDITMRKQ